VATFKKGGLEPVIQGINLEHILLETDSPYLAPTPNRGKRNEPSFVELVNRKIAQELGKEPEEIGEITSSNSINLFE